MGIHSTVKLNPTLLGPARARELLGETLGYDALTIPDSAFEKDTQWQQAVDFCGRLGDRAAGLGLSFGVKFSNTLIVGNHRDFFPKSEEVMYLSGPPLHVLAVNLVGCFFIGLVMYLYLFRGETDDRLRFFLVAGFLGSLTTFSTFGFDTFELVRDGYPGLAIANVLANVIFGIGLAALGWQVGRWMLGEVPAGV